MGHRCLPQVTISSQVGRAASPRTSSSSAMSECLKVAVQTGSSGSCSPTLAGLPASVGETCRMAALSGTNSCTASRVQGSAKPTAFRDGRLSPVELSEKERLWGCAMYCRTAVVKNIICNKC